MRIDRRSDDDQRRAYILGNLGETAPQLTVPRAHEPVRADPIAFDERALTVELRPKRRLLVVELRIERKLGLDEQRRDEEDARASIGRELAGEVERVTGLLGVE